jgi:hypothetical protein
MHTHYHRIEGFVFGRRAEPIPLELRQTAYDVRHRPLSSLLSLLFFAYPRILPRARSKNSLCALDSPCENGIGYFISKDMLIQ